VAGGIAHAPWTGDALGFVGVRPGLIFTPDQRFSLQTDVLLAIGAHARGPGPSLLMNVIEPRVGLGVRLGDWGRAETHVGLRHIPKATPGAAALSAPTVGVGLRLGWF